MRRTKPPLGNEAIRSFGGETFRSVYFRELEECAGKAIHIVGAGGSSVEIVIQSSGHAATVYFSLRTRHGLWRWLTPVLQMYHSFANCGVGAPLWEVPSTIRKPRTKGFTALSVQSEHGTDVSEAEFVILATRYYHRFPSLDPSDPYYQPSRQLPTDGRHSIAITNPSAFPGEQRLAANLKYLLPLGRQRASAFTSPTKCSGIYGPAVPGHRERFQ